MSSSTPSPSGSPSGSPTGNQDWPAEVAARIESVVGAVREKTTVPAILAAEGVVYGVMLAVLGAAMLILFVISLVRVVVVYLPLHPYGRRVWIADAAAAAILLATGTFLWRKRRPTGA